MIVNKNLPSFSRRQIVKATSFILHGFNAINPLGQTAAFHIKIYLVVLLINLRFEYKFINCNFQNEQLIPIRCTAV